MSKKIDLPTVIEKEAAHVLSLLGISADVSVEKGEDLFTVNITSEDSGILIGYHGETLQAVQLILSLIVAKKAGEFSRIIVNVGDYRKKREEKLKQMALDAAKRAKETKQEVALTNLLPWQRRVVHMVLQDDPDITSESRGEGQERQLYVLPK